MAISDLPRERVDRDEIFIEHTKSICPVCKIVLEAEVNVRENKVFLRRTCPDHGVIEGLIYGDAEMYFDSLRYNKPGTLPLETQTHTEHGCPLDCGLCPDHKQHACLGIIEVNTGCNLDCPICFADSGTKQPDGFSLTMEQVETALDAFVRAEGEPEVCMYSGGEPTIHPLILDFIGMAYDKGCKTVNLNTNGIKLAHDKKFVEKLATSFKQKPNIYMQFDGFNERTHLEIRGPRPAQREAEGARQLRRVRAHRHTRRRDRKGPQRGRGRRHRQVRHQASCCPVRRLPARHALRSPQRVRPDRPADELRDHPRPRRPAARSGSASPTSCPCRAASRPAGASRTRSSTATTSCRSRGS